MRRKITIKNLIFIVFLTLFLSGVFVFLKSPVHASSTDGTIDSSDKYAWGENIGWLNFGTTEGNVHVTDSALTGYAWGENVGWINLNPSYGGVANDGEGNLSGYAWSENTGWINFRPTDGYRVTINSSGEFLGYAWGENIGWIVFNCVTTDSCPANGGIDYKVKTDWRPQNARPACNNSSDDDGDGKTDYPSDPGCSSLEDTDETDPVSGGGGMPSDWWNPPKAPVGGFGVSINNGAESVISPFVVLFLRGGPDTARIAISNFPDFRDAGLENYTSTSTKLWNLCWTNSILQTPSTCPAGTYTVYAKFYAPWGKSSEVVSDGIIYKKEAAVPEKPIAEIPTNYRFTIDLKYNQKGDDIRYLQIFLKSQEGGIYPEGIISGWFGPLTKNAVIRFQEKYASDILAPWGLINGTGFVGKTTRDKINEILGR